MTHPIISLAMSIRRSAANLKPPIYALGGFSGANYYATLAGGGEAGVATGFVDAYLFVYKPSSALQMVGCRVEASSGRQLYISAAGALVAEACESGTTFRTAPTRPLVASDIGKLHLAVLQFDGSKLRLWLARMQSGDGTAMASYVAAAAATRQQFGAGNGGAFPSSGLMCAELAARGVPSQYQIEQLYDIARVNGDLPDTFPINAQATEAAVQALGPKHWFAHDALTNKVAGQTGAIVPTGTVTYDGTIGPFSNAPRVDGAGSLISNEPAATFKYLHGPAGATVFLVVRETDLSGLNILASTHRLSTPTVPGVGVYMNGKFLTHLLVGAGANAISGNAGATSATTVYPQILEIVHSGALSPDYTSYLDGVPVFTQDYAAALSSGNPETTLVIGAVLGMSFVGKLVFGEIVTFDRALSAADSKVVRDYLLQRFRQPTVTHRWSLKDTIVGQSVVDGQPAPASLSDTVTLAASDAMGKQGAPIVRMSETQNDGKQSFSAAGFNPSSALITANGAGIRGAASGFTVRVVLTMWAVSAGTSGETIIICGNWQLYTLGLALRGYVIDGAARVSTFTMTPADAGYQRIIHFVMNASGVATTYLDGVAAPSTAAGGYTPPAASVPMVVGFYQGTEPAYTKSLRAIAGGNYVMSAADIAADVAAWRKSGRLPTVLGDLHLYDATQDVAENGGPSAGFPAQMKDRIGTDHLTRVGGLEVVTQAPATGIGPLSGAYLSTPPGGGIAGNATGFSVALYYRPQTATGDGWLINRHNNSSAGWCVYQSGSQLRFSVVDGTGAAYQTAAYTLQAADYLSPLAVVCVREAGFVRIYVKRVLRASTAITGFTAYIGPTLCGALASNPASQTKTNSHVFAIALSAGSAWTQAEAEAITDEMTSTGGIVTGVVGKTDHIYNIVQDIDEAGGRVPVAIRERVSGIDHMLVIDAPLQVAEQTRRTWSYETETSPIMNRTADLNTTSKYVACAGGTSSDHASGMWWAVALTVASQPALGLQHLCGKRNGGFTNGWGFSATLNNTQIAPRLSTTGTATLAGPVATIAAADVGKILLIGGVVDPLAGVLRTYHKRAEVGTGTGLNGTYLPAASSPCVMAGGLLSTLGGAAAGTVTGVRIYGLMCGRGLPNLARWQTAFDACVSREDIVEIPGMTEHLWSWTRDARDGFDPWISGVRDRIGTDDTTNYGSVGNDATFARAFGW